jgi:cell division septal protein FtsQ
VRNGRTGRSRRPTRPAPVDLSPRNARRRSSARVAGRRRAAPAASAGRGKWLVARAPLAGWYRPGLRLLFLGILLGIGALMLTSPAFAARQVEVVGGHHLSPAEVLRRTGLSASSNLFLVTPENVAAALRGDPYVKSVAVRTSLPDRVEVSIQEWEPLALVHRDGRDYLLNQEGTVLGPGTAIIVGPATGQPHVELSWAAPGTLRTGEHGLSGRLLEGLRQLQEILPAIAGLNLKSFDLTADQQLVVETREGPRILFGQMATGEQLDSLDSKLTSLKQVHGTTDLAHSKLDYINLMNPAQPVTHAIPSPSPSPRPSPTAKR